MQQIEAFLSLITQSSSLAGWGMVVTGLHFFAVGNVGMGASTLLAGALSILKSEAGGVK